MAHANKIYSVARTKLILLIFLFAYAIFFGQNVHGIDVSHWQGNINWSDVASDGQVYAWAKASEGMTYQDPQFMANMSNGIDAGVIMGAYHFARPDNNLAIQDAENFLNTAGAYIGSGFLPPVLDLENPYSGGQSIDLLSLFSSSELSSWVMEWSNTVELQTGIAPIIYVNGNYANYLNTSVNMYGLWFAQPDETLSPPVNIGVWDDWSFKQYSWWGEVSGIVGDVDLNIFNGGMTEFNELIGVNTTDISSDPNKLRVKIFPNPVQNEVQLYGLPQNVNQIFISDLKGKIQIFQVEDNKIDVSKLSTGFYMIAVLMNNHHFQISRFQKM